MFAALKFLIQGVEYLPMRCCRAFFVSGRILRYMRRTNPVPTVNALASPLYKDFSNGTWYAVLFSVPHAKKFIQK